MKETNKTIQYFVFFFLGLDLWPSIDAHRAAEPKDYLKTIVSVLFSWSGSERLLCTFSSLMQVSIDDMLFLRVVVQGGSESELRLYPRRFRNFLLDTEESIAHSTIRMKFRYFIIHRFLLRSKIFFAFLFGQTWCGMMTSREPAGQSCTAGNEIPPCARLCCCRWFSVCVCVVRRWACWV